MAAKKPNQTNLDETLSKSEAFFVKHKNAIIGAVAGIIIVVGGIYAYNNFVAKPNAEKASTLLAQGQNYFANGDYDLALNGDNRGYTGFLKIADKYSSTKAGNLARLYAGISFAQKGDAESAVKYLEKFSTSSDQMISPAALGALGNSYAKIGQVDKAIATLKKAAEKADNNTLSPIYLVQAGQLLESQNKPEEAKKLYEEVKTKYNKSAEYYTIDKYIERVTK
ncbi:MAG: tetratricopeptide repeat protein [Bacteroidaceae bacterium]|nr:tetratricopeptide repeat protein [Bacteroidaceae bacterium]